MTPTFIITSPDPLAILTSSLPIVQLSHFVTINESALEEIAGQVKTRLLLGLEDPIKGLGVTGVTSADISIILTENCANFCFWAENGENKWTVEYPTGTFQDGWYALVASFRRAIEEGIHITDAKYLSNLTLKDVQHIFRSSNTAEIPLLTKRLINLQEAGQVLTSKLGGSFANWLETTNYDAIKIVQKLAHDFPSFRDVLDYQGHKLSFYKRAQWGVHALSTLPGIKINNIEALTAFADYKLPQILRHFGVFTYTPELSHRIDSYQLIPVGSQEEIEIRASTIWAVELIRQKLGSNTAAEIDEALWLLSQNLKSPKPYHRTYTIYY